MQVADVFSLLDGLIVIPDVRLTHGVDRAHEWSGGDRRFLRFVDHAQSEGVARCQRFIRRQRALPNDAAGRWRGRCLETGILGTGLVGIAADLVEEAACLRIRSLNGYRLSAAAHRCTDETISSPLARAGGFASLDATGLRPSRYTFRFRGLARDCLP